MVGGNWMVKLFDSWLVYTLSVNTHVLLSGVGHDGLDQGEARWCYVTFTESESVLEPDV